MILGLFKAIGEVFHFAGILTDSKQRRERYELLLDKKAKKALEAAEQFILCYDSFAAGKLSKYQWKLLHNKYKKLFFAND